ncbi:MAG: UDP-N-acetylmuramoyl-tripeptide--D-alanyl-D-alanine ligase [Bacteroidota bacterium]
MNQDKIFTLFRAHPKICTDTRKIQSGDLFFALKGDRFDGNKFAVQALEKGAGHVVMDNPEFYQADDPRMILVPDSLKALQELALQYRRTFQVPFLGLTGSNGKTTTKELIISVLQQQKKVAGTKGNFNNHIGVPLTLLDLPPDTEIALIEMGTNQPGDIQELTEIAEPSMGLITNIGYAHLERLLSLKGVQQEKGALYRSVKARGGMLFLNLSDPHLVDEIGDYDRVISYGTPEADFHLQIAKEELGGTDMDVYSRFWTGPERFHLQLSGSYNALNALAAIAVGHHFGLSVGDMQQGLAAYQSTNNRSQLLQRARYDIWLDAYNANPSSMRAAIGHACERKDKKVALILGDMYELGPESEALHAELGTYINDFQPVMTVGVGEQMQAALQQISSPTAWFVSAEAAQQEIVEKLGEADFILLKGSRAMALESLLEVL